jgi:zinc protease
MGKHPAPRNSRSTRIAGGRSVPFHRLMLCCAILAALFAVGLVASPAHCQKVERAVLSNGLIVVARTNPGAQIAAASLFVRAGASDETDCPAGSNYLLANILTEPSAHPRARDFTTLREKIGDALRINPAEEYTEFSCSMLTEYLEDALNLLAYMVTEPRIRQSDLQKYKEFALQELSNRDGFQLARDAFLFRSFQGSRMALPVQGTSETLQQIQTQHLLSFFQNYYGSNNMVLAVVSNRAPDAVISMAESAFKKIRPVPERRRRPAEASPPNAATEVLERAVASAVLMVGFRTCGLKDPMYPALVVCNAIVGGGKGSRLFRELRQKRGIGYEVGTMLYTLQNTGYIIGYVITEPEKKGLWGEPHSVLETARKTIEEQFRAVASGGVSDDEIERAKKYVIGAYALRHQRSADQAFLLGWWETCTGNYKGDELFTQNIENVRKEDVIHAAKKFFDKAVVTLILPAKAPNQ